MTEPPTPSILDVLTDDQRRDLLRSARRRRFKRGEVVFHEGDPGDAIHLIEKGHVVIRVSTPRGEVATLTVLGRGESFGEGALLSPDSRRTASAVAVEGAETMAVPGSEFERLRAAHPGLERVLTAALAAQVRRLSGHLLEALYVPAEQRLLRRLEQAARSYGLDDDGGDDDDGGARGPTRPIEVPLTQDDLATMAGTARPTANRVLKAAEEAGYVSLSRGKVTITDAAALHRAAR